MSLQLYGVDLVPVVDLRYAESDRVWVTRSNLGTPKKNNVSVWRKILLIYQEFTDYVYNVMNRNINVSTMQLCCKQKWDYSLTK